MDDDEAPRRVPTPIPDPPPCEPTAPDPVETTFLEQLAAQGDRGPGEPLP